MSAPLGKLRPEQFLEQYWQKKPCLIRQAFPDFSPMLDENDLAGLACEEMAESRLITGTYAAADWDVTHGPFSEQELAALGEQNWTLLVQDVEKHYAPLQKFLSLFSFIPNWRLDDLMISYAVAGGSVGPHVDQYDVFLLQASGRRRWQIAGSFEPELLSDCPLNVLKQFKVEQEWVLEAGDMLYLPPGLAHYGLELDAGMTWSVGSRAPSAADLLQGLGEWLAFLPDEGGRYSDPGLRPAARAGEITAQALDRLRGLMLTRINDIDDLNAYLAAFMSRFRLANEPAAPPEIISTAQVLAEISDGAELMRNPWTRLVWIKTPTAACIFAAGQRYECSIDLAVFLCGHEHGHVDSGWLDQTSLACLTGLINNGHFLLVSSR